MRSVSIYFTSGKSVQLELKAEEAEGLIQALTAGPGSTTITGDNGTAYLINRDKMTHVEVS